MGSYYCSNRNTIPAKTNIDVDVQNMCVSRKEAHQIYIILVQTPSSFSVGTAMFLYTCVCVCDGFSDACDRKYREKPEVLRCAPFVSRSLTISWTFVHVSMKLNHEEIRAFGR